jgi:hypothetical protein
MHFKKSVKTIIGWGLLLGATQSGWTLAEESKAITIKGTVGVDYRSEVSTFGLKVGNPSVFYQVSGFTHPDLGLYRTDTDLSGVSIVKHEQQAERGSNPEEELKTEGVLTLYPRKRFLNGVTVAGIPASGMFLQGAFNDGIFLDGLEINAEKSAGLLDYNNFVGYYRSKRGLQFGNTRIASSLPGSNILSNYDNYIGQHRNRVTMIFGSLRIEGLTYYNDLVVTSTDSDGNSTTSVVATTCLHDLTVTHVDGTTMKLAPAGDKPTEDDLLIRKWIAMSVLFSYDLHH